MSDYPNAHRYPPMPSRAQIALDASGRQAQERAERASANAASRVLNRGSFALGRFGTIEGRELEVVWTDGGIVIADPARSLSGKFVCGFTFDQAAEFIDMLARALEGVNDPTASGDVGVVRAIERALLVERATGRVVVREIDRASDRLPAGASVSRSAGTLFSVNSTQASKLTEPLRRGLPSTVAS